MAFCIAASPELTNVVNSKLSSLGIDQEFIHVQVPKFAQQDRSIN